MAMTLEQRGLYRELIDHCWECGSAPLDEVVLIKITQCGEREFRRAWPIVKKQFFEKDGRLHHAKVDERKPSLDAWHENRREAGRKGGLSKSASSAKSSAKPEVQADLKPSASASASPTSDLQEQGETHTQPIARAPNPPRAADLNGHTSQRFAEFWNAYPRQQNQDAACREWCSVVSIEDEPQVFACLENYLASDEVSRAVVKNPDKWLYEQHINGWKGRWPAKTIKSPTAGASVMQRPKKEPSMEELTEAHRAQAHSPDKQAAEFSVRWLKEHGG